VVTVHYGESLVGRVVHYQNGTLFEYDPAFREELSPFTLPLREFRFFRESDHTGRLPGMLFDCLPDAYGTKVLLRELASRNLPEPGPLEKLCYVGQSGIGALTFAPERGREDRNSEPVDLAILATKARAVLDDGKLVPGHSLLNISSVGGAQPKALLYREGDRFFEQSAPDRLPVLVKFSPRFQPAVTAIEHAYLTLAKAVGIRAAVSSLHAGHLVVERFDRDPSGKRLHYLSYMGLTEGRYRGGPEPDYLYLLADTFRLTRDHRERLEMFRRALFNLLTGNHDDHAKNHGFLRVGGEWKLAPAFDLTHVDLGETASRAMAVCGRNRQINRSWVDKLARESEISPAETEAAETAVLGALEKWPQISQEVGVPPGPGNIVGATIRRNLEAWVKNHILG
jgi:serine/threonine-protein kinase HipA